MKRILSALIAVIIALTVCLPAFADWQSECSGGTYKVITHDGFVADTFYGVDAIYNLSNKQYQCNELVIRFYKEVFGLDVFAYSGVGFKIYTEGYEVKTPDVPHPGDVIYRSPEQGKGNGEHWALVKSYENGVITLFEQNVVWQGKAGIERKLKYPSDNGYSIFTVVAKPGYPELTLKEANKNPVSEESKPNETPPADNGNNNPDNIDLSTIDLSNIDIDTIIKYINIVMEIVTKYILPLVKKLIGTIM